MPGCACSSSSAGCQKTGAQEAKAQASNDSASIDYSVYDRC
jgi:hypothetical protein